jgi:hypothetical protein
VAEAAPAITIGTEDIPEHKRMKASLRESEESFRRLLAMVADAAPHVIGSPVSEYYGTIPCRHQPTFVWLARPSPFPGSGVGLPSACVPLSVRAMISDPDRL